MRLRTALFWCHLVAGVTAGFLILLMCVTGVLMTYERQLIEWSDRQFVSTPPSPDAARLRASALLERAAAHEGERPTGITLRADTREPVAIAFGQRTVYADAFTGEIIGAPTTGVRELMSTLRGWHRWLAMEGDQRAPARLITGWANVLFLFIVISGMYLWLPRVWTAAQVRTVALFRGGLQGKARDFNWHNVIGIWSAVPLAIVVATAMPISFPWANALVYRVMGDELPTQGQGGGPGGQREQAEIDPLAAFNTLDARWAQAEGQVADWRSINLRVPARSEDPLVFLIDEGNGGQPQLRSTLTLEAGTGSVVTWEPFDALSPGRQLRSWSRFTHTGEAFGLTGQTIAGLVSGGGAVLVWTGLALALRRFVGWRSRQRRSALSPAQPDLSGARSSFLSASMARHDVAEASRSDRSLTQPGVIR